MKKIHDTGRGGTGGCYGCLMIGTGTCDCCGYVVKEEEIDSMGLCHIHDVKIRDMWPDQNKRRDIFFCRTCWKRSIQK